MKYKEKFANEMKGKKPQYDLKDAKIYQTLKDANNLASEVRGHILAHVLIPFRNMTDNQHGAFRLVTLPYNLIVQCLRY